MDRILERNYALYLIILIIPHKNLTNDSQKRNQIKRSANIENSAQISKFQWQRCVFDLELSMIFIPVLTPPMQIQTAAVCSTDMLVDRSHER